MQKFYLFIFSNQNLKTLKSIFFNKNRKQNSNFIIDEQEMNLELI